MIAEERADSGPGDRLGGQMLRREPGAEVLDGSSIFLDEVRGMPAPMR